MVQQGLAAALVLLLAGLLVCVMLATAGIHGLLGGAAALLPGLALGAHRFEPAVGGLVLRNGRRGDGLFAQAGRAGGRGLGDTGQG